MLKKKRHMCASSFLLSKTETGKRLFTGIDLPCGQRRIFKRCGDQAGCLYKEFIIHVIQIEFPWVNKLQIW